MSNGAGLKQQWGVSDPQVCSGGEGPEAVKFNAGMKVELDAINQVLQYTAANAEKAKHDALTGKRDTLIQAYQVVIPKIDPKGESKPEVKKSIEAVLAKARPVSVEAKTLKAATEKSLSAWKAKQPAFDKAVTQIEELQKWEDKAAPELRKSADATQAAVNERKYDDAVQNCQQILVNIKPPYEAYQKQLAAKAAYDTAWPPLKTRIEQAQAVKFDGEKTKTAQFEMTNARQKIELSAGQKDYVNAKALVDKLPATLDAFDKTYKEEKSSIRYFQPKFSVANPSVELALNTEAPLSVMLDNAADLAKDVKYQFEWDEPPKPAEFKFEPSAAPAKGPAPVGKAGFPVAGRGEVKTNQSTGVFKIKAGMPGTQTLKYFVTATQGSEKARWEVPQATTVTVKPAELAGTADTGKKYKTNERTTVKVQFKNINKPKEMLGNGIDCTVVAESMGAIAPGSNFKDPWVVVKKEWAGDSEYMVELKAEHAGIAAIQIQVTHPSCSSLKYEAKLECVSKFAEFIRDLEATNNAKSTITGKVSDFLGSVARKLQEALKSHQDVIKADNENKPLGAIGAAVEALPDAGILKVLKLVGGKVIKLAEANAVEETATKLTTLSKGKLGANIVIASAQCKAYEPTIANLPFIQTELTSALSQTLDNTVMAWRNWAKDESTDKEKAVPFDPSDALLQSATVGGTRVLDLPGDTGNTKAYEADIWGLWVKANPKYFTFGAKDFNAHNAAGPITPIRTRLGELGVAYPK